MVSGRRTGIIKGVLAAVVVLTVLGVGSIFYRVRNATDMPAQLLSAIPENTEVTLTNIEHTATSDGRTQWRLTAEKALLTDGKQQLLLTRPSVVFFTEDGREITMTGERGTLVTQSNDIAVEGHVVVSNRDYRLVTEALRYSHGDRVLTSDLPVSIEGRWVSLTAQSMRVDLNASTAVFEGTVKGWLARDIS
ncbi:MAG: LPS export ABC transporter periplasmic protein LptC [Pseudomonadota bacterium]